MTQLKLYGPAFSYFLRAARIMCKAKGFDPEIGKAPFGEEITPFSEGHGKLHPWRKIPVLIHDELILPETMAMASYLDDLEPGSALSLFPDGGVEKAKCIAMAQMTSQYVHHNTVVKLLFEFAFPKGENGEIRFDAVKEAIPKAGESLDWIESVMGCDLHLFGSEFSICDAYLIPMVDYLEQLPEPFNLIHRREKLHGYIKHHRAQSYCEGVLGPKP